MDLYFKQCNKNDLTDFLNENVTPKIPGKYF